MRRQLSALLNPPAFRQLFVLTACLLSASAGADTTLATIYVTAPASSALQAFYPSSVRVFTKETLENRHQSVAEWVARESGLHLSRVGDDVSPSKVSIRGSTATQVDVYLNGIRLNPAADGSVNLSALSLSQVDRITIYKGKVPLAAGGDPVGGAIFIETATAQSGQSAEVSLRYGSFNSTDATAAWRLGKRRTALTTTYNGRRTDGDFTYLDDNGTPANPADDDTATRQNNAATEHDWQSTLSLTVRPETTLDFFQRLYRLDRGIPGTGTFQSDTADLSETQSLSAVTLKERGVFIPAIDYTQKNSFLFQKDQFSDPEAEIGLGDPQDNDDITRHFTHQDRLDWTVNARSMLHTLFAYEWEQFAPEDYLDSPSQGPENTRHRFQWGAEAETSTGKDRLLLSASASLLHLRNAFNDADPSTSTPSSFTNTQTETLPTGSAQADLALIPEWFFLDADLVRAVRAPQFAELFGDRGGVIGNPQLRAEKSWNFSSGLRSAHGFATGPVNQFLVSSAYFERHSTDLIQFTQTSLTAQAQNVGESRARGLEVNAQAGFLGLIDVTSSFTYQHVTNTETGKEVPGQPRYQAFGELALHRRLGPGAWELYGNLTYEDERYLDFNNSRQVVHASTIDAGASYTLDRGYRVFVEARNLGNDQLVDVVGYPLPGRAVYGGIAWRFPGDSPSLSNNQNKGTSL